MRVLLVDDDPLVLTALKRRLRDHVEVVIAVTEREALEALDAERFDVVVTDYEMPVDGLTLLERIRARHPTVCRCLMSAGGVPGIADHLTSGLVQAFLDKPFTIDMLMEALSR